jgi:hypothetical protein
MTTKPPAKPNWNSVTRAARAISLDIWAVVLALVLSALVYVGAIKRVPW